MGKGIFITGTGTSVGKTYISGLIVKKLKEAGLNAGYYKAALSGVKVTGDGLILGDADYVNQIGRLGEKTENLVSYVYRTSVSPHLAAKIEGNPAELEVIRKDYEKVKEKYDYITMEGSGGIVCPIRFDCTKIMLEDIINELQLSTIIVADAGLGVLNATVLTVEYMKQKNIPVKGIILNRFHNGDFMEEDNKEMLQILTGLPILVCVKENDKELDIELKKFLELYK